MINFELLQHAVAGSFHQLSGHFAPQVVRFGERFYFYGVVGAIGRYERAEVHSIERVDRTP